MTTRRSLTFVPFTLVLAALLSVSAAQAQNWVQIASGGPMARSGPASAYDPVSGKVLIFGGYQVSPSGLTFYLADTWAFDGTTWAQAGVKAAGPSPRTGAAMAYDAVDGRIIMFGGWDGQKRLGDTWAWDRKRERWIRQKTGGGPAPMSGAMGFLDPSSNHAFLIGGFDGRFYQNTTWKWNGRSWDSVPTATVPYARAEGICAPNPVSGQVVMFGGLGDVNPNNTWTWDGKDWTLENPVSQPPGRFYSGAEKDHAAGARVVCGAGDSDTWVWDGSNWTQLFPANAPSPRQLYAMTTDDALGGHPILFGGEDTSSGGSQFNDTWEFIGGK